MGAIKAIETEYRGHLMRSRLEARWAVFFDALGILWHYEEEGYELPSGRYLPDFRLCGGAEQGSVNLWCEVKGSIDHYDLVKVIRAAVELPRNGHLVRSPQVLLLTGIPAPESDAECDQGRAMAYLHPRIDVYLDHFAIQHVYIRRFKQGDKKVFTTCPIDDPRLFPISDLPAWNEASTASLCELLESPLRNEYQRLSPWVNDAYRSARSARFEYGESGAML